VRFQIIFPTSRTLQDVSFAEVLGFSSGTVDAKTWASSKQKARKFLLAESVSSILGLESTFSEFHFVVRGDHGRSCQVRWRLNSICMQFILFSDRQCWRACRKTQQIRQPLISSAAAQHSDPTGINGCSVFLANQPVLAFNPSSVQWQSLFFH